MRLAGIAIAMSLGLQEPDIDGLRLRLRDLRTRKDAGTFQEDAKRLLGDLEAHLQANPSPRHIPHLREMHIELWGEIGSRLAAAGQPKEADEAFENSAISSATLWQWFRERIQRLRDSMANLPEDAEDERDRHLERLQELEDQRVLAGYLNVEAVHRLLHHWRGRPEKAQDLVQRAQSLEAFMDEYFREHSVGWMPLDAATSAGLCLQYAAEALGPRKFAAADPFWDHCLYSTSFGSLVGWIGKAREHFSTSRNDRTDPDGRKVALRSALSELRACRAYVRFLKEANEPWEWRLLDGVQRAEEMLVESPELLNSRDGQTLQAEIAEAKKELP